MRLAGRLWNLLAEIERVRIKSYRRIMCDEVQEQIDQLHERKRALINERNVLRKQARAKVAAPEIEEDELKHVSAALHMLVEHQKSTRQERHDARRGQLTELNERTQRRIKRARQAAASLGLFWGTYKSVLQAADRGRQSGGELRFRSFRGEGTLTAQVMGGANVADCVGGGHSFFQMDPATPGQRWRYARIRIGSHPDRSPVWLAVPIVYHREIPPEGRIKSVSVTRRIVAGKVRWSLNVMVTMPTVAMRTEGPAVAIDVGWRLMLNGVRVGYWQDDTGGHGEVVMATADIQQFKKIADLHSITDCNRDRFLRTLVAFLAACELDEAWKQRTRLLAKWHSSDRIAALVRWWSDHRLAGDEEIYQTAIEWRRQYLHLASWWRNQQEQMTLRVREQYRIFAVEVARKYGMLILEDFDRKVAEVTEPKPADKQKDYKRKTASNYRRMVSPSVFRSALLNACRREGLEIRIVPGAYSTSMCHACQTVEKWDQPAAVIHRCGNCGALWDQDQNAAINLLARGKAVGQESQGDGWGFALIRRPLAKRRLGSDKIYGVVPVQRLSS
jgi:hypothetical protein